eukprot:TRINITY_DN5750_c0_g1_i1.p1 TRINITY_DN5750_c0_g1~~TRINITY_DN5750_c0_g1_i1.p1  ORF type:complete len:780 (+),score=184.39 TRINITY_DN5750_c0_g1_i1:74-2413(+)
MKSRVGVVLFAAGTAALDPTDPRRTCCSGCPERTLPFCDRSLGFVKRAADLAARLTVEEQVAMYFSYPGTPYISRYNVKSWSLDHTCIHGLNKANNVSVFPHAIAQGAAWDPDLVARIGNATAVEARILSESTYNHTKGSNQGAVLSCDGGPLANTAHDPRWGRISETYGEDPFLVRTMGVTALQAMQNPQKVAGGHPGDVFMATRQVTRHFIGYHGATPDIAPAAFNATARSLADSYLPTYGAFQRPNVGFADGIMCAMTELNGVPSCADPFLLNKSLRQDWGSDAIVQTDCCDSIRTINNPFHYQGIRTDKDALLLAANSGVGVYFGFSVGEFKQDMLDLVGNGTLSRTLIEGYAARVILSFMRLGFFDSDATDYPWPASAIPASALDGPAHRALAREAAAKSVVLLKNENSFLPLKAGAQSVAVIGPFARCEPGTQGTRSVKERQGECYLHSYNGEPTSIVSIFDGIQAAGGSVSHSLGSNVSCDGTAACWQVAGSAAQKALEVAVSAAAAAEVTVLAVGLGASEEAEGHDRVNMTLPPLQQQLLKEVSAVAKQLVIVVVSAGGVDLDESTAKAVLWAPYGGQAAGFGVADVLFGAVNPSAKLPLTFYRQSWADSMNSATGTSILSLDLEVGVGRTHRYLSDARYVKHSFGFGLSYTSFAFSDVEVSGGAQGLSVCCTVTNTGTIDGAEVAQVYISGAKVSGQPSVVNNLVGLARVEVAAGASEKVALEVSSEELETAYNDGSRAIVKGSYTVWVCNHLPTDTEHPSACLKASVTL